MCHCEERSDVAISWYSFLVYNFVSDKPKSEKLCVILSEAALRRSRRIFCVPAICNQKDPSTRFARSGWHFSVGYFLFWKYLDSVTATLRLPRVLRTLAMTPAGLKIVSKINTNLPEVDSITSKGSLSAYLNNQICKKDNTSKYTDKISNGIPTQ